MVPPNREKMGKPPDFDSILLRHMVYVFNIEISENDGLILYWEMTDE